MGDNFQPLYNQSFDTKAGENPLLAGGPYETRGITIEQDAGAIAGEYVEGRLLNVDVDGKFHLLADAETTVALNTTGEVLKNNLAATDLVIPFKLSKPPIPGTVTVATTADGSATPVVVLGTDNGEGMGVGADGWFEIDYETGNGVAYLTTAPTATHDLKAGFKHRTPDAADAGETWLGMPKCILMEDVDLAKIQAGDVKTVAYFSGSFNKQLVKSFSEGYRAHLAKLGIILVPSSVV